MMLLNKSKSSDLSPQLAMHLKCAAVEDDAVAPLMFQPKQSLSPHQSTELPRCCILEPPQGAHTHKKHIYI